MDNIVDNVMKNLVKPPIDLILTDEKLSMEPNVWIKKYEQFWDLIAKSYAEKKIEEICIFKAVMKYNARSRLEQECKNTKPKLINIALLKDTIRKWSRISIIVARFEFSKMRRDINEDLDQYR
ncbi:hypothetical protein A3Q56_08458 [Intoshia linei]|uniref:Uncharacterized protein n=1 Tax=Intoshia linei TaxID=1819745 RepID=A0A177APA4_9BILA|nr:hypothetical protein A3Q56_08458 [Intoshia linei]